MKPPFSGLIEQFQQNISPVRDVVAEMQRINGSLQYTIERSQLSIAESYQVLRQVSEMLDTHTDDDAQREDGGALAEPALE
jgi:CRISPR/Cas system CSM-associated protein Csm2 small subunit